MAAEPGDDGSLLQQLRQVRAELERHYLICRDMDAERRRACEARDEAEREVEALRLQLLDLQRALQAAGMPASPISRAPGLVRRIARRVRSSGGHPPASNRRELEFLRASGWFDADWYLARYPDVLAAGVDPLAHFDAFGWKEARDPGPRFDTAWYLRANPDVAAAGVNPLLHFLEHGLVEGRPARAPR